LKLELGVLYRKGQGVQVKVQKEDMCLSDNKNLVPYFLGFFGLPNLLILKASLDDSSLFSGQVGFILGVCGYIYFGWLALPLLAASR